MRYFQVSHKLRQPDIFVKGFKKSKIETKILKRGKTGSGGGCFKKEGGLEPP